MAEITFDDVAVAIGRPISDEDEQAQITQWIDDVEMLLAARLGALAALDQSLLVYVEREVVIAWMKYRANSTEDTASENYADFLLRALSPWWTMLTPATDAVPAAYTVSLWGTQELWP